MKGSAHGPDNVSGQLLRARTHRLQKILVANLTSPQKQRISDSWRTSRKILLGKKSISRLLGKTLMGWSQGQTTDTKNSGMDFSQRKRPRGRSPIKWADVFITRRDQLNSQPKRFNLSGSREVAAAVQ
ncbi:unnamed protein product [Strongylus vulgaris]|uniref:Uncharacterized protein n=1 Tax=Strongylus vulgaris TaxID=40348 RepID=A0A3P7IVR7_STRVU|nr:unnamed protein product [Strongylus vulgaris]